MRRLIFVNRFYWPDQSGTARMLSGVASGLAEAGFAVSVITSRQLRSAPADDACPLLARETVDGVSVFRVPGARAGGPGAISRLIAYLTFHVTATIKALVMLRKGDVLIAKTDPPLLGVPMALVAFVRRAALVNWTQDLFPEVAFATGLIAKQGVLASVLTKLRTAGLKSAAMNVVLSAGMAERLHALGVPRERTQVIPNFADGCTLAPQSPQCPVVVSDDREGLTIMYAGNLGRVHEFETALGAGSLLACEDVDWRIVGTGVQLDTIRAACDAKGLERWQFEAPVPEFELAATLASADVQLVTLSPASEGLVVPSKLYAALAAGRPVVYVGGQDSELGALLEAHEAGFGVTAGASEQLADTIRRLAADPGLRRRLGQNARRLFEAEFDRKHSVARWQRMLRSLVAVPSTTGGAPR